MFRKIEIFIALLILIAIVIFIAQNADLILIKIFTWKLYISKILVFLLFTIFGFILGVLVSFMLVRSGGKS